MGEFSLVMRFRMWLAGRLFRLAGKLDESYDVWLDEAPRRRCEICNKPGKLDYHGWHDDGDPMLTCVGCAP